MYTSTGITVLWLIQMGYYLIPNKRVQIDGYNMPSPLYCASSPGSGLNKFSTDPKIHTQGKQKCQ